MAGDGFFSVFLFCQNLLQMGEARQGVHLGQVRFTLDQGQRILDELVVHAIALLIDPLAGNFLLHVGDLHQRNELGAAGILPVLDTALKTDHAAVDAVDVADVRRVRVAPPMHHDSTELLSLASACAGREC